MKRGALEKLKGLKITNQIKKHGAANASGHPGPGTVNRREQRRLDQSLGLVPFAVKLEGDLVTKLQELAETRKISLNELVTELLRKAMVSGS